MKEILITSSVLILALLILRLVFGKKVRRTLIYAAWALVALRLLIPVQIGQISFSVLTVAKPVTEAITEVVDKPVAGQTKEEVYTDIVTDYIEKDPSVFVPEVQEQIKVETELGTATKEEIFDKIQQAYPEQEIFVPEVQQQIQQQVTETADPITLGQIAMAVWLAGVGVMAVWFVIVNLRHSRMLRKNREQLDCESPIPVYVSEKVGSPCLVGLFRPAVYLTPESATPGRLCHVLTHELTHYAHKDHIWSLVRCVCLCAYWFNPLVWVAAWFSRRDCELACDEAALKRLGEDARIAYGKTLLDVVSHASTPAHLLQTATAMNETKRQLKERVNFIVKKPKISMIAAASMVLVCAIVAGCVAAGPAINEKQIQRDAVAYFSGSKDTCEPEEVKLTIISQFGDTYALFVDVPFLFYLDVSYQECVNDLTFNYPDSQTMYIYSAGQFYKFQEAFDEKIITADQLTTIWEDYYEKYPNRKDWESSLKPIVPNPTDPTQPVGPTQPTVPTKPTQPEGPVTRYLLTEEMHYDTGGNPWYRITYSYDSEGRVLSKEYQYISSEKYPESSLPYYICTYEYNERGHLIYYGYDDGMFHNEANYVYTYNEDGTVASYSGANGRGEVCFEYDQQGRLVHVLYMETGQEYFCAYDEKGELINVASTKEDASVRPGVYDEDGRLISKGTASYRYDEEGRLIEKTQITYNRKWTYHYINGVLSGVDYETDYNYEEEMDREYTFDGLGNVTQILWDDGKRTEYQYITIELTREENEVFLYYWTQLNEVISSHENRANIIDRFLPKFNPEQPYVA